MKPPLLSCVVARLLLGAAGVLLATPSVAHAQTSTKIFVASYGGDGNDGSRGAPKRNFQAAHDAVAAGGQIVVLDTAGYGALTITKSLNITVPPGVNGFVTVTGSNNGITINAGFEDTICLRGLIIEGGGRSETNGSSGIKVSTTSALVSVKDCTVRNFQYGILADGGDNLAPTRLYLQNCLLRSCGLGANLRATQSGSLLVTVAGCRIEYCNGAVDAVGGGGSGHPDVTMVNSVITHNAHAIHSVGTNAIARISNCTIIDYPDTNINDANHGQILSRSNNTVWFDGVSHFTGTFSAR